ncbi:hypothetical protein [Amycolatopsis eburnea]|uniref:Uncharacterized protein n=1 Tax=Amycolatopsis eburnea TaxID=2267691 RepID=A0A427SYW7_9PSEU|nr:hypothetical protein [Amycolatopsis eburnea]RSD10347.1 hypothetical protein EIY87_36355 [Amycolatopsis eburnea]
MTEPEAFDTLRQWARTQGMNAESIVPETWTAAAHGTSWVLAPRGRTSAVYIVSPAGVRPVNRSVESLADVLAGLE